MSYSVTQFRALSIAPHFSGLLSIIGSSTILFDLFRTQKERDSVYKRIMIGMSVLDITGSLGLSLSTWLIDSEDIKGNQQYVYGNEHTCAFQGFLAQLTIPIALYNVMLATYYLLRIKYRMRRSPLKKFEPFFHLIPLSFGLSTSIVALSLGLYNNAILWCWVAPNKSGTLSSWKLCRWLLGYGKD